MPRTRHDIERDQKVDEITEAAARQLRAGGFSALSVAAIARELGLSQNAIYWYFPSRDHLFVAVLRRLVAELPARKPSNRHTLADRVVWIVNQIAEVHPLLVALRERSRSSDVVAAFMTDLESTLRDMVLRLLQTGVPEDALPVAADAFWATIEGVLLQQLPSRRREAIVRFTLDQFIGREAASLPA